MLLRHAPGIVLSSSSSCVVAWQKRRRMLELAGDGPTPEQRSRCPRLSSPSLKTPTAPRKEYDVSKRIKEPTRAPLQSIDSRAVQVRLNSSVPVSVAQAKQGVQEQNVARQSGSVGCGLEAPICMHVEQHLENRAENKYAVDHAARLEALEAALDISLESLQQTSSDSQSAGGINADADGADSKIETDAGGVDDINAQIDRFLLLHLHAGDLEICTQLAQDTPADPIIGEDNLPSRVGTASSQHCATEEHSKMERLSSNAFTAIPRLAQELPLEQEEQRSPTARGQRSFLVLEHEKQRKEQEEVLLRNEHLVHDNCKVQKPEHVPFPKVLEVKPMVVGMRRGDSAAEKHGFQSGDIVPVKPSVDGLVVNDDDLKCHLMDPAAQPQQQIAEQEEQQVRNCTFFAIYSCAFGSNTDEVAMIQECSSINASFPLLSSCSHYSSADSSHAWGTTAFGQVVDCSKYNTMVDTRQVVSSSKTVVPEDDDPLSLFSSHSPGGRPWEGSYAVVSPHGLRNSDRGDVDSKVPAHLLSGPTPWMGTPPRVGAARFGGSWRAWQESSADSGLLVWGTGASDTRAVQVHDSIPLNNELVKEQIWDEATMAAVAFQVTASAVLCLSPSPYKKEKC